MSTINLIILGEGVKANFIAATLAHTLSKSGISVFVIERGEKTNTPNNCTATLSPDSQVLHEALGFDESDLLKKTQGNFNFGLTFDNWLSPKRYTQTYETVGVDFNNVNFSHYFFKANNPNLSYDDFSLSAQASHKLKFSHPAEDPRSVLSTLNYGLNLNSVLYSNYLKQHAIQLGVRYIYDDSFTISINEKGFTANIQLNPTNRDFFIDCSGQTTNFNDNRLTRHWPSTFTYSHEACFSGTTLNTRSHTNTIFAENLCLKLQKPLRERVNNQYLFSNTNISEASVLEHIQTLTGLDGNSPKTVINKTNYFHQEAPWHKNSLSLGDTALRATPTLISDLDILYSDLQRFISLLPASGHYSASAYEYNRQTSSSYNNLMDYSLSHNFLHQIHCGESNMQSSLPTTIAEKVNLFCESGIAIAEDNDIVPVHYWTDLFMGSLLTPKSYNPLADLMGEKELRLTLERMRTIIFKTAESMPYQNDYLNRYAPLA